MCLGPASELYSCNVLESDSVQNAKCVKTCHFVAIRVVFRDINRSGADSSLFTFDSPQCGTRYISSLGVARSLENRFQVIISREARCIAFVLYLSGKLAFPIFQVAPSLFRNFQVSEISEFASYCFGSFHAMSF